MAFRHPPKRILTGKLWLYSIGALAGLILVVLLILFVGRNQNPEDSLPMMVAIVLPFAFLGFGALWMIKTVIREEPKPWPLLFLAGFLPFAFLWYYFERVKPDRIETED